MEEGRRIRNIRIRPPKKQFRAEDEDALAGRTAWTEVRYVRCKESRGARPQGLRP